MDNTKIMIINWRWGDLEALHTEDSIQYKELEQLPIEQLEGRYYKEYPVEPSELCKNAKVVTTAIYNEDKTLSKPLFHKIIDHHTNEGSQVMVFLHRTNHYEEEDVEELLNDFDGRVSKCFLFADGRDYLYYKTQKSGFLDDAGGFMNQRDRDTEIRVKTFDQEKGVLQPYFDRVWTYYEGEFESKIFQLKEEIFDQWLPILMPRQPQQIEQEKLLEALKGAKHLLYLRVKSFLGFYDELYAKREGKPDNALQNELDKIRDLEKQRKVSYIFDDARQNLRYDSKYGKPLVSSVYEEAIEALKAILFKDRAAIPVVEIREFARTMEDLIKVVPGEID